MRGKQGFKQTRNRDVRVVFAGIDGDTVKINTATPTSLNGTNPSTIFSGFQPINLPQNTPTTTAPTARLANDGNKFALLSYMPADLGATPTASQILVSPDAKIWRTRTLPTRDTTNPLKHAWAEVYGRNGRIIVSHGYYPDVVVSDNNNSWTLLQDVFAVNGFQPNNIVAGGGVLLAAADDSKVIYRSLNNGITWTQLATGITVNDSGANPQVKALDQVLALAYGPDGATNVFFMLARRNDVTRYRYVLTSPDGVTWTQRLRVDLGTTGTPQEPLIVSSPTRVIVLWNNLTTATTLITTTSASTWTQVSSTPAANWRAVIYDGNKFVAVGEPFGAAATPIVMTMTPIAPFTWNVKLTDAQKLRGLVAGSSVQIQPDSSVTLLLRMNGAVGSTTFVDSSPTPKTVTSTNVALSDAQTKWPGALSALFTANYSNKYLSVTGNPDIAMGTSDFTIEAWVWLNSFSVGGPLWDSNPINTWGYRPNGFVWYFGGDGTLRLYRQGGDIAATAANIVPLETWSHVALVRKNNKTTIYVDGDEKISTVTTFNDTAAAGGALIGRFCDTSYNGLDGYIGEFRITKGVALYTTPTFAVPTAPFLAYTPLGAPTDIAITSGDNQMFLRWQTPYAPNGTTIVDYAIQHSTDNGVTWVNAVTSTKTKTTATVTNVTNGVTYKFRIAAVSDDGPGPYSAISGGVAAGGDPHFNNVSLLLQFNATDNGFIDSSSAPKTLVADGTVSLSAEQSRWGDGSVRFQGGSLSIADSAAFGFGTGDFTIEFWAFPLQQTWAGGLVSVGYYYDGILFRQRQGSDSLYFNSAAANWNPGQNMPSNVWTHVALVRESGYVSVYSNGTRVLNYEQTADLGTSKFVVIGAGSHSGLGEPFDGYLDELRITKGVARYSGLTAQTPAGPFLTPPV